MIIQLVKMITFAVSDVHVVLPISGGRDEIVERFFQIHGHRLFKYMGIDFSNICA